jgi:preprotein translocase subunit SecA
VTYGTNNEFGFDYLRDNMKMRLEDMVQREFHYAIVDEVDSILIDEARTPLIISGAAEDSSETYTSVDRLIPRLTAEDYEKDEKQRAVTLTEAGAEHVEELLREAGLLTEDTLYDLQNVNLVHHVNQGLRAHQLYQHDTDYIVKNGQVILIDEFTGRMMEGRRLSEGLHQAIEAKERVAIQQESQTLASITFQNYFRLFPKLAGMTGTAMTEAQEFLDIYGLEVIDIPTNVPFVRVDHDDEVYRTVREKFNAIIELIKECQERQQPMLVGTVSIEKSELLSAELKKHKIEHQVLNARYHEQEAFIIAQAGAPGGVTIATNMAGRGTDIQLGGNPDMRIQQEAADIEDEAERQRRIEQITAEVAAAKEVVIKAGGLFVVASERHESRRIDNQLRGRSGRQGDPGASKFFLSLEDDLMRIFGSERMDSMLRKLGLEEGEAIVHPWINKALEKAQQKVEARNFEIRKQILKYDDVMNDQRKVVYEERKELMRVDDVHDTVVELRHQTIDDIVSRCIPEKAYAEQWDAHGLHEECLRLLALDLPAEDWVKEEGIAEQEIRERITAASNKKMAAKVANYGPEVMRMAEKQFLLMVLDKQWKDHLLSLDHLRQIITLRAFGQRDPLIEYKIEAFDLFKQMEAQRRAETTMLLSRVEIRAVSPEEIQAPVQQPSNLRETRRDPALAGVGAAVGAAGAAAGPGNGADESPLPPPGQTPQQPPKQQPFRHAAGSGLDAADPATWGKVPRNAPCPCGSGRKYKHCHGKLA